MKVQDIFIWESIHWLVSRVPSQSLGQYHHLHEHAKQLGVFFSLLQNIPLYDEFCTSFPHWLHEWVVPINSEEYMVSTCFVWYLPPTFCPPSHITHLIHYWWDFFLKQNLKENFLFDFLSTYILVSNLGQRTNEFQEFSTRHWTDLCDEIMRSH